MRNLTAKTDYELEWCERHALRTNDAVLLAAVGAEKARRRQYAQAEADRLLRQHVNPAQNLHHHSLVDLRRLVELGRVSLAEAKGEIQRRHGVIEPLSEWRGSHLLAVK